MVFSSASFLFFFLPLYLVFDRILKGKGRNYWLILMSLVFYIWGETTGVLLLLALCAVNFGLGKLLSEDGLKALKENKLLALGGATPSRKCVLIGGIALNLAVLFYFKYLAWILAELSALPFFPEVHIRAHALPLGISFFTFHAISYLVDIYTSRVKSHTATDFATYFLMFPHLVAGPIVRFEDVRESIQHRERDTDLFVWGVFRFILGINKKVLIANFVAPIADITFNPVVTPNFVDAWLGVLAYTIQIYFDFSGYSDMAIGLAAMAGIRLKENFNAPYKSGSIKEFWRRWHISLSSWLRDYLYFPLGGSRTPKLWMTYRNLLIVFLLCGLWHGAQFTFVIWGLFHGALLILERRRFGQWLSSLPVVFQRMYCLLAVMVGWVFFRATDVPGAIHYLGALCNPFTMCAPEFISPVSALALVVGIGIALFARSAATDFKDWKSTPAVIAFGNLALFVVSLAVLYTNTRNPFIYFNF